MQNLYYVSHNGEESGPFTLEQIASHVSSHQLSVTDYLYDEASQDWVLLMEYKSLAEMLKASKPKSAPKHVVHENKEDVAAFGEKTSVAKQKSVPMAEGNDEWYVLKWDNRYGPFAYFDLIRMLQEKSVFEFDYIWKPGMDAWKRIAEVTEFSADKIKHLKETKMPELSEVFFRRRHIRTKYNGSIIVHDNKSVWKGNSLEISEGGAGIVMHNSLVLPGQKIFLHFKPGDSVPPFNAVCEVISKQYVKGVKNRNEAIGYGIKFLEINGKVQEAIRELTRKAA